MKTYIRSVAFLLLLTLYVPTMAEMPLADNPAVPNEAAQLCVADEKGIEDNPYLPIAKIRLSGGEEDQVLSIDSEESIDNLGLGLDVKWSAYKLEITPDGEDLQAIFLGELDSDAKLNEATKIAPSGLYTLVLTVTNADGISASTQEVVVVDSDRKPRWAVKVTKDSLKLLIRVLRKPSTKRVVASVIGRRNSDKLFRNIEPVIRVLEKASRKISTTQRQLYYSIRRALKRVGFNHWIAGATARVIVYWLL